MSNFSKHEKITLLILSLFLLIGVAFSFYKTHSQDDFFVKSVSLEKEDLEEIDKLIRDYAIVNINTASLSELERLSGVGPSLAKRILDYRETNGPFGKKEDLMEVKGIGPKKFESVKESISLD